MMGWCECNDTRKSLIEIDRKMGEMREGGNQLTLKSKSFSFRHCWWWMDSGRIYVWEYRFRRIQMNVNVIFLMNGILLVCLGGWACFCEPWKVIEGWGRRRKWETAPPMIGAGWYLNHHHRYSLSIHLHIQYVFIISFHHIHYSLCRGGIHWMGWMRTH